MTYINTYTDPMGPYSEVGQNDNQPHKQLLQIELP